uniref:ATP synthase complex subunit 8 n=1 Tax=Liposcelis paeta TaxID=209927 RepID=A0A096X730_9NEOP|nr:ATP synthase F0 subunit 8 [Liposcelis paeta]
MLPQMAPIMWLSLFFIMITIVFMMGLLLFNQYLIYKFFKTNTSKSFFNFWSF